MNDSEFAHFWELRGHRVIRTSSCYWYNHQPLFYLSIPYHRAILPTTREEARILMRGPAVGIRFPAMSGQKGRPGGLFVCSEPNYDLGMLDKKARNQTRRGLENCVIEQFDFSYLAQHGYALHLETLARQQRQPSRAIRKRWDRFCEVARETPDCEVWGAWVEGQLAAFMVTALVEDYLSILDQNSATAYLANYPNNALVFAVTKEKLKDPRVNCVSYGLKSLENTAGLDRFKVQMGFALKEWRDVIVFNPVVRPFLASGNRRILEAVAQRFPKSELWRKVRAMQFLSNVEDS